MGAPFKQILTLDFETKWDSKNGYTIRRMTTEEYIRDKRFGAWGVGLHWLGSDEPPRWVGYTHLRRVFDEIDWSTTAVLCHNAQFDVSVLTWVYGHEPAFILDTLSMARALRGIEVGNSLAKLAEEFGLPPKGKAVHTTDGKMGVLMLEEEKELAEYCKHDVFLCEEIYKRLAENFPKSELRLIDITLKMYTRPLLELDPDMLSDALMEEKESREALLAMLGVPEEALASNPKFAELLRRMGVEPPMKKKRPTPTNPNPTGKTFAFAKNDAMFQALLNGDNGDVALLCETRLRVKSTTERTRAQRFMEISERGRLPVPLSYYGAITGRWTASKGSAINMQNLKRGSFLRKAIMAPEGNVLVVGDLSQIEPRVLGWLADYDEMLDIFRSKQDAYAMFGAQMFGIPGMTKETHPDLRQSAKSALLGAGYGLGWASFAAQLLVGFLGAPPVRYDKDFAKKLGVTRDYIERFVDWEDNVTAMAEIPHTCTAQELLIHCVAAKKIIDIYRATAHPVVGLWELCTQLLEKSLYGGQEYQHKCLLFRKEQIVFPNGMSIRYPGLKSRKVRKKNRVTTEWVYGADETKLYAGKITNNITQGLARIVMTDGMIRTAARYPIVGTVHDEQIVVVPEAEKAEARDWILAMMVQEPKYMPGVPLAAEVGAHRRYGLAKG